MKMRVANEYASLRLDAKMRVEIVKLARNERRTLSQMLRFLVEEAMDARSARPASLPENTQTISQ